MLICGLYKIFLRELCALCEEFINLCNLWIIFTRVLSVRNLFKNLSCPLQCTIDMVVDVFAAQFVCHTCFFEEHERLGVDS